MRIKDKIIQLPLTRPWLVIVLSFLGLVLFILQFPKIKVDTDPENMLSKDEPVRVYHNYVKKTFDIRDFIVLGVIDESDPQGVFTRDNLNAVYKIVQDIKKIKGVVTRDIIAPSETDDIQASTGWLNIDRLQKGLLSTDEEAKEIAGRILDNPLLKGKLISNDGKQLCIYIPIVEKKQSHRIATEIERIIEKYRTPNLEFHITGLPVAEDTFGVEMFKQMAISSPLAMLLVILLLFLSIRKISLSLIAMAVPFASIIYAMGLLIGMGFPVHIMSSMIPIFIIPITIGDGTHILSAFYDVYQKFKNKTQALKHVLLELWDPILYTSLTTAAGFASLASTPIPPVQVFGLFTAFGVMCAWFFSLVLVPAFIQLLSDRKFEGFGMKHEADDTSLSGFARIVHNLGVFSVTKAGRILIVAFMLLVISIVGIMRIEVNDNPVKWFSRKHKIRIADTLLNKYFGGTYMAYLVFESNAKNKMIEPEMLNYMDSLQNYIQQYKVVGKTSSIVDIIKKIAYELHDENPTYLKIPDTRQAANQYLFLYQNSGDPEDLFKFIDYDYRRANIWFQLKSGDNKDMTFVKNKVEEYIKTHPLPEGVKHNWAGLTYVNVVWQDKMVKGMFRSFMGSFVVVFILISIMFRSLRLGFLGMIPMSLAVLFIYGVIGLIGKDYDMPVAVLSALTLGLSVDFAIHFIQRLKTRYNVSFNVRDAVLGVFSEPARAIARVVIIVGLAFLPLVLAPLIPYKTVGVFMSAVTILSGISTLFLIPALVIVIGRRLFEPLGVFVSLEGAFQFVLGMLFLISLLGARFVNKWFLSIAFLVSIGLIQSAFTGFCLIKVILAKLGLKEKKEVEK